MMRLKSFLTPAILGLLTVLVPACRYTEVHERTVTGPKGGLNAQFDGHVALVKIAASM